MLEFQLTCIENVVRQGDRCRCGVDVEALCSEFELELGFEVFESVLCEGHARLGLDIEGV